jgi:hypothetical protein
MERRPGARSATVTLRRGAFLGGLAATGVSTAARAVGFARALIVANRARECDALEDACSYTRIRPFAARYQRTSGIRGRRGIFESANGTVEIWCIEDLLPTGSDPRSSAAKARVLPAIVGGNTIALVGAFGTAASVTPETQNGNVIIGTNTFLHDPHLAEGNSHWKPPKPDALVTSTLDAATFRNVIGSTGDRTVIQPLLLTAPLAGAQRPVVIADRAFVALSDVNVTHVADYARAGPAALQAYHRSGVTAPIGSLDTTHALIRAYTSAPFFFVSGITNRVGAFEDEVTPRFDSQTFVASYNAGVAVAAMALRILYFLAH